MKVLVDTHIFLWSVQDRARLKSAHIDILTSANVELWVSVASVWECKIKADSGKLALIDAVENLALDFAGDRILPVQLTHAAHMLADPPNTKDPFDRLLLSQCEAENMRLLTADKRLLTHRLALSA
ncbi:MAG: type II toxin-antitoxin system VapC family toxin [Caulobacterales bacterium]